MPGRYWVRERPMRRQYRAHAARETMSVEMTKGHAGCPDLERKGQQRNGGIRFKGLGTYRMESGKCR